MALLPGAPPAADFDDPIGMLVDCHRRVERFLGAQERVAAQPHDRPLEGLFADGAATSLRYFRTNAPWHTADEEESLFPRLRASPHPRAPEAVAIADALQAEHADMEPLHDVVNDAIQAWLAEGGIDAARHTRMGAALDVMGRVYAAHIAREDDELFPLAELVLDAEAKAEMGREMRARRL